MKKTICVAALLMAGAANADIIGATAGVQYWNQGWDGGFNSGSGGLDLNTDLGLDDDNGVSFYAALEHPIPLIPNVMLRKTQLEISGSNVLDDNKSYKGANFASGETIYSTIDLSHTDATIYYEILDNWVNLDIGLTLRAFDGRVRLATDSDEATSDISLPIPMAYAKARFELPFTGAYATAEGNIISFDGDSLKDISVGIGYEVSLLSVELGYRVLDFSIGKSDINASLVVEGAYLGLNIDI
jgi:outer membrane protein